MKRRIESKIVLSEIRTNYNKQKQNNKN